MTIFTSKKEKKGQTAVEYMLLLGAVVAIVLVGFKTYLPRIGASSNTYYNRVAEGIYGKPNPCGQGGGPPSCTDYNF